MLIVQARRRSIIVIQYRRLLHMPQQSFLTLGVINPMHGDCMICLEMFLNYAMIFTTLFPDMKR